MLVSLTRDQEQLGYNQQQWTTMTANLNAAASVIATTSSLSDLNQLLSYDGIWVDLREPGTGSFSAAEASNLGNYISTGRRVVFIGENPTFSSWDNSILSLLGGSYAGGAYGGATPTHAFVPLTSGVNSLTVANGGVASGGTSLFTDHAAMVWGPARNALVVLDSNAFDDDRLTIAGNHHFAINVANWISGGTPDASLNWMTSAGGSWQSAAGWSDSAMPACADDAVFNLAADAQAAPGYTVAISSAITAKNILVPSDRVTLQLSGSGSLSVGNSIAVGQTAGKSGLLTFAGTGSPAGVNVSAQSMSIGSAVSGVGSLTVAAGAHLKVSGATVLASNGSLDIAGSANLASIDGGGAVTVEYGGTLVATHVRAGSLNIAGSATIQRQSAPRNNANTVSVLSSLTLSAAPAALPGTLDLNDNDLIIKGGDLAAVSGQIKAGLNAAQGYWNGHGITSSAAASDSAHLTALGVILNDDGFGHPLYGSAAAYGLFDNQNPAVGDILIRYTYFGDADLSGHIDGTDFSKIDNGFNNHLTGWFNGDFNYDGVIDGSDYSLIDNASNTQGQPLVVASGISAAPTADLSGGATVPEPGGLLAIILTPLALRRTKALRLPR